MRKTSLALVLVILMIFPTSLSAKNREKAWEFGVLYGLMDTDTPDSDVLTKIDNSPSYGLRFGYHFSAAVEAEFFADYQSSEAPTSADTVTFFAMPSDLVDPNMNESFQGVAPGTAESEDVTVLRAGLAITGNFLTDRDGSTVPYITAGLGVVQETRDGFPFEYVVRTTPDPNIPQDFAEETRSSEVNERFDSSAILTIGVGARTFFTDNFGVRYEIRYIHHDSFDELVDEYLTSVGVTWLLGPGS
jgi:opacity protein-like surface antigen